MKNNDLFIMVSHAVDKAVIAELEDIKAELLSFKRKNEYSGFMIDTIKIDDAVAIIDSHISRKEQE